MARRDTDFFLCFADGRKLRRLVGFHLAARRVPLARAKAAFFHGQQHFIAAAQKQERRVFHAASPVAFLARYAFLMRTYSSALSWSGLKMVVGYFSIARWSLLRYAVATSISNTSARLRQYSSTSLSSSAISCLLAPE